MVVAGESPGGEADFSTALLTKCVSSFGRNDGFLDREKKTDNGNRKVCSRPALPVADGEEVGWDGSALQVFGGVPGGAVGVVDRDEVNPAEGAYVMHPDVGVAEAVAAGAASQFKGFGDVFRWRAGGEDACFGRDAVDGDLDALDGRRGEVVEHEVKTLCGTGLSGVAGAHGMAGSLAAGEEAYGAS
jgi:hypothetical protein